MLELHAHLLHNQGGRSYQEDAYGLRVSEDIACVVVADGAGGHGGGDLASKLVVRAILEQHSLRPRCSMEAANALIQHAQQVVLAGQSKFAQYPDMRSTVILALVDLLSGRAVFGNVGDSRAYWFRGAELQLQTRDHSLVQQMVDAGMIAACDVRQRKERSVLTSSLGSAGGVEPYVYELPGAGREGDLLLLCTDGVWEYVLEQDMQELLRQGGDAEQLLASLERWVDQRAPENRDNFTALLAVFSGGPEPEPEEIDPETTVIGRIGSYGSDAA
ncbi:protein phosphatase 2C domain-containing protein [Aquabacterium sp. A7-Y]|uniref:PP2C family protein-serine/threonine phosphatase n=1 Tax=Aquabacterium sp. A7-Y TaxID=1349605 RepID=UPI00223DA82D|nr:protein phosphatase 2C domain-containing protein [Aquabacterium sp. A7-Y]MCW7540762.1 protein phosphatase 2C domain-containing protein [Aquabacterium sp. A7-Y]